MDWAIASVVMAIYMVGAVVTVCVMGAFVLAHERWHFPLGHWLWGRTLPLVVIVAIGSLLTIILWLIP